MSANEDSLGVWDDAEFWRKFQTLETEHLTVLGEHDVARRTLERVVRADEATFLSAWAEYKAAVLRLDDAASALADLQSGADSGVTLPANWLSEQA